MISLARSRPTKAGRTLPRLECLEHRHVLSAMNLPPGITAVQFEPSADHGQNLVISFDQSSVDAIASDFSLSIATLVNQLDANGDFELGGPAGTVFGFSDPPSVESVVQDGNSTDVVIPLNAPLPAGTYQVSLNWGSNLDFAFSLLDSSATNSFWSSLASGSEPATIASLTIQPQLGATIAQATNLGPIGPAGVNIVGTLNPTSVPAPVDFYKFTLPPGQVWQVGVAVSTQNIGSSLLTGLTLFGPGGNVLAESVSGQGLVNAPNDPYLFTGLTPTPGADTYYVGVSGYGNMPYDNQGYDPVTGIPGTQGMMQPPGAFELSVMAEPHIQATQLVSFSLGTEDPLSPSPTSMTLTFSAPVNVTDLFTPDEQETALEVVSASGQTWPVTADTYQASNAQLTLVFDEPLPAGRYTLIDPASGGFTDLAGEPVVAAGEPAGVLATWTVAGASGPAHPHNLGVLWPSTADVVWPAAKGSFSETTTIGTGDSVTYRWVVIVPGYYKLQTEVDGSSVEIVNASGYTTTVLDPDSTNPLNNYLMHLSAGVYELRFTNVGTQQAVVQWLLKIEALDWEKIINNGVDQSAALSLMTFAPPAPSAASGTATGLLSIPPSPVGSIFDTSAGPVPSSLLVTLNTGLVGQPSADGPGTGSLAEAASTGSSAGAGQSLIFDRSPSLASASDANEDAAALDPSPAKDLAADAGPIGAGPAIVRTNHDPEAVESNADMRALAQAEWVMRIGSFVQDWFLAGGSDAPRQLAALVSVPVPVAVADQPARFATEPASPWRNRPLGSTLKGHLGATASLITLGIVAYRLRHPIQRRWCERAQIVDPGKAHRGRALPRPHSLPRLSRMQTRVRKPGSLE